jgi:hypothetical protein
MSDKMVLVNIFSELSDEDKFLLFKSKIEMQDEIQQCTRENIKSDLILTKKQLSQKEEEL